MTEKLLFELCEIAAPAGHEHALREVIAAHIKPHVEWMKTDSMGNLIVYKKGEKPAKCRIMLDAHMDEVGFVLTAPTSGGLWRVASVGGISGAVLCGRRVRILTQNGEIPAVFTAVPVHLLEGAAREKPPDIDDVYLDIGAENKERALSLCSPGDVAVFDSAPGKLGSHIMARAIDDRAGCAVLVGLLKKPSPVDFYAVFSVQEEVGLRGARTAAFAVKPDVAIVLEATTAADYAGVPADRQVCRLGGGVALSFMDGAALYDRELYNIARDTAKECKIKHQIKEAVAGGNNAGAISVAGEGAGVVALSVPCRNLHAPLGVCSMKDIKAQLALAAALIERLGAKHELV